MTTSLLKRQYLRASFVLLMTYLAVVFSYPAYSKSISRTHDMVNSDPIFIIGYDPHKVHFDQLDTSLLKPSCDLYLSVFKPLLPKLNIYAEYKRDGTNIYIADAGVEHRINIFVLRNGICSGGIAHHSMLQVHFTPPQIGDSPVLTDTEVAELFKDALIRHEKAFGGKVPFLKWLEGTRDWKVGGCNVSSDKWCPGSYDHPIQPFVLEILNNYRK